MAAVLLSPQRLFLSAFVRREGDICGLFFLFLQGHQPYWITTPHYDLVNLYIPPYQPYLQI